MNTTNRLNQAILALMDGIGDRERHLLLSTLKKAGEAVGVSVSWQSEVREWLDPLSLLDAVQAVTQCGSDEKINSVFGSVVAGVGEQPTKHKDHHLVKVSGGLRSALHLAHIVSRREPCVAIHFGRRSSLAARAVVRLCDYYDVPLTIADIRPEAWAFHASSKIHAPLDVETNPFADFSIAFLARAASRLRLPLRYVHFCASESERCERCLGCLEFRRLISIAKSAHALHDPWTNAAVLTNVGDRQSSTAVPVLVVGRPFSGSTILGMLLAAQRDVHNLGEVAKLPSLLLEGALCSCGSLFFECPFWSRFLPLLPPADLGFDEAVVPQEDVRDRWAELFDSIADSTGTRYIVDTSKDPKRALDLMTSVPRVMIIHLVRSPQEAWNSDKKYRGHSWPAERTVQAWYAGHRFILDNLSIDPSRYIRIRFEDLTSDPCGELSRLMLFLGANTGDVSLGPVRGHQVGGNPVRSRLNAIVTPERRTSERIRLTPEQASLCNNFGYISDY